ncbi:MerR family DNA-binding transcriptional regulator [Streptomyces sp. NPDC087437]|uniref:MerR family DNA-binding transcriptional regulator n=1 Tax=Streptomyces sp. NPDC087437 TaxID=3365789 RepID=UPI00380EB1B0
MRYLPIGELADKARVRASALRYWEERGLLPGARREGGPEYGPRPQSAGSP